MDSTHVATDSGRALDEALLALLAEVQDGLTFTQALIEIKQIVQFHTRAPSVEPLLFPLPGEVMLTIRPEGVIGETSTRVRHAKQYRASDGAYLVATTEWEEKWILKTAPGVWMEVLP